MVGGSILGSLDPVSYVAIVLAFVCTVAVTYLVIRNERVYRFRTSLVDDIAAAEKEDKLLGLDSTWRYRALMAVTYEEMAYDWRPLTSYYKDWSFIMPPREQVR